MNFPAIPPLISSVLFISLGLFVFLKNPRSHSSQAFGLMCLVTFWWQFSWFILFAFGTEKLAKIMVHVGYTSIIFIPYTFYHFFVTFLKRDKERFLVLCAYLLGFIFLFFNWTSDLYIKGYYRYPWGYYPKAGFLHPIYLLSLFSIAIRIVYLLYKELFESKFSPFKYNQIKYILFAFISYTFASSDFAVNYGLCFYPIGFIFIMVSLGIMAYTIVKYRLLDINIALTRAGIFIVVYALVLGFPFWLGYTTKSWLPSTMLAVFLATLGPFIYTYLRRQAENRLRAVERRYQQALLDLAKTMTRIRDLDKLLQAIVLTVVDAVRVSFAAVYLKDDEYKSYRLKHCFPKKEQARFQELIPLNNSLIKLLYQQKRPLVSEETAHQDKSKLDSGLVVPCFIEEDELLGFLVLGAKPNNQIYTTDDLIVFETLSYSTSLAIENCYFWHEIEDRHRKARLQEMDTYSYSLAHEIDNPMQVVIGQANLLKKYMLGELSAPAEKQKELTESFDFILEAARRVSGMVKAIRDFGSPTTGELKPLKIDEVVESFSKLYFPQFKNAGVAFVKELPKETIFVRGEKPELMQVLVILANNSLHAMQGAAEKKVTLTVKQSSQDIITISFRDTGYGIRKELLPVIFSPFTTTKASTEGTGMGLYNAKKIIERHKGEVWAESEGQDKGAAFFIKLPVARDIILDEFNQEDRQKRIF